MKKWMFFAGAMGSIVGVLLYGSTKKKQKRLRAEKKHVPFGPYEAFLKRPIDIVLSSIAIVILSPILGVTAILVRTKLGSPVVFKQKRPGYQGEIFEIFKFRTMLAPQTRDGRILTDAERVECIEKGIDILSDEERLTSFGKFLRASSMDELLELFNILRGEMSLVGPRPLATIYLPYYNDTEKHRHDVRPGLTGLAQINGRNAASWKEKFAYDVEYVEHVSFAKDAEIILKTFMTVLKRDGIGQGMERPESFNIERQREWEAEGK